MENKEETNCKNIKKKESICGRGHCGVLTTYQYKVYFFRTKKMLWLPRHQVKVKLFLVRKLKELFNEICFEMSSAYILNSYRHMHNIVCIQNDQNVERERREMAKVHLNTCYFEEMETRREKFNKSRHSHNQQTDQQKKK